MIDRYTLLGWVWVLAFGFLVLGDITGTVSIVEFFAEPLIVLIDNLSSIIITANETTARAIGSGSAVFSLILVGVEFLTLVWVLDNKPTGVSPIPFDIPTIDSEEGEEHSRSDIERAEERFLAGEIDHSELEAEVETAMLEEADGLEPDDDDRQDGEGSESDSDTVVVHQPVKKPDIGGIERNPREGDGDGS